MYRRCCHSRGINQRNRCFYGYGNSCSSALAFGGGLLLGFLFF